MKELVEKYNSQEVFEETIWKMKISCKEYLDLDDLRDVLKGEKVELGQDTITYVQTKLANLHPCFKQPKMTQFREQISSAKQMVNKKDVPSNDC